MATKIQSGESNRQFESPTTRTEPLLSLPSLPPLTPELIALRAEGVHVHAVSFDPAGDEKARAATVAALARLSNPRPRGWYWQACQIAALDEGVRDVDVVELRADLDREEEFSRWADFEREAILVPLAELHAHADFRVDYQVRRRSGKVVAVRFTLSTPGTDRS